MLARVSTAAETVKSFIELSSTVDNAKARSRTCQAAEFFLGVKLGAGTSTRKSPARQLAEQPGTCRAPFAAYRGRRGLHDLRGFVDGESAEVPQLDQSALLRIHLGEPFERVIQSH